MNDFHEPHTFTPGRMRPSGFGQPTPPAPKPVEPPGHGDECPDDAGRFQPAIVRTEPDQIQAHNPETIENIDPAASGSLADVPDEWITGSHALEILSLAGIDLEGRKLRMLCARNELENMKVKNEKNQWQYFINPTSVHDYAAKNSPNPSGTQRPETRMEQPDAPGQPVADDVEKPGPAASGHQTDQPDAGQGDQGKVIDMLRDQLKAQKEEILFLRDEAKDNRQLKRDLKDISSKMLDTFAAVATNRQIVQPTEPPARATYREGQGDTHDAK